MNVSSRSETLANFFVRMQNLDGILRIITSNVEISALFTFRGQKEEKVIIDLSKHPVSIRSDENAKEGNIFVTIKDEEMHEILLGNKAPGLALSQRELLLRGSPSNFAKFIPLFDFGPMLYKEHLADIGEKDFIRSQGVKILPENKMENIQKYDDKNVELIKLGIFEKIFFSFINFIAFLVGYIVGILRHKLFENLSLFEVLENMSKGLDAANPKNKQDNESS